MYVYRRREDRGDKKGLTIEKAPFGTLDGKEVDLYTLTNAKGVEMKVTTYGGIVTSLKVPDRRPARRCRAGVHRYQGYTGAAISRPTRISARSSAVTATASAARSSRSTARPARWPNNNGPTTLHGGVKGFDKVVWTARPRSRTRTAGMELTYLSKDGEEGFPGNLSHGDLHAHQ